MSIQDLIPWRKKRNGRDARRPSENLRGLTESMDRDFEDFWTPAGGLRVFGPSFFGGLSAFAPELEVEDAPEAVRVFVSLPGTDKNDIQIEATESSLTVRGERKDPRGSEDKDGDGSRERTYGAFYRRVSLPTSIRPDAVTAKYKNGVLAIELPKTEEARGRRIDIE